MGRNGEEGDGVETEAEGGDDQEGERRVQSSHDSDTGSEEDGNAIEGDQAAHAV